MLLQADLRREDEADRLFAEAREALGGLDVCAAVAGVWPEEDVPLWELSLDRWQETLAANLTATFLTARGFLREVEALRPREPRARRLHCGDLRRGRPCRLRLGQVRDRPRAPPQPQERGRAGRASAGGSNAVCPGWTISPMTRSTLDDPSVIDRATRTMALRKVAQVEDVARQIVVLASDELSGHVTGQVVVVAGGMEGRVLHG